MHNAKFDRYIGKPEQLNDAMHFPLSSHLRENLVDVCDLVSEIFETEDCALLVQYDDKLVNILSPEKQAFPFHEPCFQRLQESAFADIVSVNTSDSEDASKLAIGVPIVLLDHFEFGALIFSTATSEGLSNKNTRILEVLARDIQNFLLQRRESAIIEESTELQRLITQLNGDWIFVKDEDFKIVYANDAFLQVYPEDMRDKVIGFTTIEEYSEEEAENFLKYDKIAFEQGKSETVEDLHMPDGSHLIVNTTKMRFKNGAGKQFILCVCRDITERENLIRKLKKANQELDDFTSIASHDLKSPLNAIRRLLVWIDEESRDVLSANAKENLDFVLNRAARMHNLLNDLLRFAKIGRDDVKITQISLKHSVDELRPLIDIPEHFVLETEELIMHVPAVPFNTVLLNLVSNAFKHNDKDIPSVLISASISRHYYMIKIKDNGPGINPKYHDRVFSLFQTLKPRDEVEGSGMGLSVVKKYVEYYEGKIHLQSDGENGTEFTIMWPVSKPQE